VPNLKQEPEKKQEENGKDNGFVRNLDFGWFHITN